MKLLLIQNLINGGSQDDPETNESPSKDKMNRKQFLENKTWNKRS